ncbi:MAG: class II fumarate hydratase, partial [Planctomycetes bacterium]|nr:class II fumarate hydratase [Planctomycetota bacterium]
MKKGEFRIEKDSMGEIRTPAGALYGAQTQRAVENFKISDLKMPRLFIRALALIKGAAALTNNELGRLGNSMARAIHKAAGEVEAGMHDGHFPIDLFQTGSGTSTNMNANEVIARLASMRINKAVSPNDHVNLCQSSNDVIPSAIHISACLSIRDHLLPALDRIIESIDRRRKELNAVVKTGRTHLMDATPVTMGQELGGWMAQLKSCRSRIHDSLKRLRMLALGGTAVGTGLNASPGFADKVIDKISRKTGFAFKPAPNKFEGLSAQDHAVEMSGQLKTLAVAIIKISNDLRWMNSGPLTGLGEIALPALQPGSSIMPGKVNPVIPEAAAMAGVQVIGNDTAITVAGQSGNFQLNVMLPLVAYNL